MSITYLSVLLRIFSHPYSIGVDVLLLEDGHTLKYPSSFTRIQVARYSAYGHYESHHDSEKSSMGPCCADPIAKQRGLVTGVEAIKAGLEKRCRLCRFITVLYYLSDTEEGGALAGQWGIMYARAQGSLHSTSIALSGAVLKQKGLTALDFDGKKVL